MIVAPQTACNLIAGFEGFRARPYRDAGKGVWTIGFGSTHDAAGRPVTASTAAVTRTAALALLARDAGTAWAAVTKALLTQVNENQIDALTSFAYNVGVANFLGSHTLARFNEGNVQEAADDLLFWDEAGGKVLGGLLSRRQAERALFLQPVTA